MALEYWWVFAIALTLIISVSGLTWFIVNKVVQKTEKKVYLANTVRLTQTTEYKKLFKQYSNGLLASVLLLGLAATSLAVISGKPVLVEETETVKHNRDIVLCLDVSGSMTTVDIELIEKFKELSEQFAGERLSLVIFNSVANQVFPLTDDYTYMTEQFDKVVEGLKALEGPTKNPDVYDIVSYTIKGDGASLVGDGLTACLQSFDTDSAEKRSRSVILATDNIINGEEIITLPESIDIAIREDSKVYGINPESSQNAVDAEQMKTEMIRSGGEYYPLSSPSLVPNIVDRISAEQTSDTPGKKLVVRTDIPQIPIVLTILSILIAFGLAWRFKV